MSLRHTMTRLALILIVLSGVLNGCISSRKDSAPNQTIPKSGQAITFFQIDRPRQTEVLPVLADVPLPSPVPTEGLRTSCLTGSWEVEDLQQAMTDSFNGTQSTLQLESMSGQMLYEFSGVENSGTMKISFVHLTARLAGQVDGAPINAQQLLEGSATAQYEIIDGQDELLLTQFGGEGVFSALEINGQLLAEGSWPAWQAFTSGLSNGSDALPTPLVPFSRVTAQCSGDQLTVQSLEPFSGEKISLRRMP